MTTAAPTLPAAFPPDGSPARLSGLHVFILGAGSDIGTQLALQLSSQGATIVGTFRNESSVSALRGRDRLHLIPCDANRAESVAACASTVATLGIGWNVFISCVGLLEPIGRFFSVPFETWETSVRTNSTAQLRVLHALHPYRRQPGLAHVIFFAGGGTNSPFRNYSAYCLGKIALIKMCELIDDEEPDLNAVILGTGWVNTKIHRQTLAHPAEAGANHARTAEFMSNHSRGTHFEDILACITWCLAAGREAVGGRNFSIVHDAWRQGGTELLRQLRQDPAKYKLRRLGNA